MSISACLIAKDEEAWIGDCIENIKPICKEIIVVDTGSKDRTMEIAREKGLVSLKSNGKTTSRRLETPVWIRPLNDGF